MTLSTGKVEGIKVPGRILEKAYRISKLSEIRLPHYYEPGESVEALLGYAWLANCITAEDAVEKLYLWMKKGKEIEEALAMLVDELLGLCR